MKKSFIAFTILSVSTLCSHGVVTLNSASFASLENGVAILGNDGNLAPSDSSFYRAGIFSEGSDFSGNASSVLEGFTPVTTTGGFRFDGAFNSSTEYDGGNASNPGQFTGQDIFIVIGDSDSVVDSEFIAVFDTGETFVAGDEFGNASQSIQFEDSSNAIYGTVGGEPQEQPRDGFSLSESVQLVNIPEPSSAILGVLGIFGLFRRKR